ncbi:MAG: hypothetical protein JWM58_429 [Rhizobium sp.]|nr:hypothetical protein [Rhizobium sp.]
METDPDRHSKSNADPRTIDLSAEEVKTIAPGEAEGTDEDVTASTAAEAEPVAADEPLEKPAFAEASRPVTETRSQSSMSLLAASLIGGVVVLAGAAGLQYWGVLPSLNSDNKTAESVNLLSGQVEAMKKSIATLEAAKPEVDFGPVNDKIAAIETKLASVPQPNGLSADADTRLSALNTQVTGIEAAIAVAKKAEEEARAGLLMRFEALEKKANEPRDDVEVAIAIASAGLKAAIDRGGPFTTELDTLTGIDPEDPAVKELKTFAAIGVPARSKLIADFPAVADRILASINSSNPDQSLTDRLISSAFSSIKVRPVGNVEGEGPDAIVARMEARLTDGDLKGAEAEWQKLPETGKAASADYQKALNARIRVEELVGSTLTRAVRGTDTKG